MYLSIVDIMTNCDGFKSEGNAENIHRIDVSMYKASKIKIMLIFFFDHFLCKFYFNWLKMFVLGITFPNSQSQADLMSKIYNRCKIDVNSISYVEAHSTGTKVPHRRFYSKDEKFFKKSLNHQSHLNVICSLWDQMSLSK